MILTIKIIFACKQYVNLAATRHKRGEVGWGWGRVMERDGTETLTVAIHNMQALITGPEMRDEAVDSRFVSKVSIFNRLLYRQRVECSSPDCKERIDLSLNITYTPVYNYSKVIVKRATLVENFPP